MNNENTIVFCGGGNMCDGIIDGLISREAFRADQITVNARRQERCDYFKDKYGVNASRNADDAIRKADIVVISVTPNAVGAIAEQIRPLIKDDAVIVSIAAGVSIADIESVLGEGRLIARIMPNTLIPSGCGYSAVSTKTEFPEDKKALITRFTDALGQTMFIDEKKFDTFTAFSSTGPVWVYKLAEALIDAGVYSGLSREDSRDIVLRNLEGVSLTLQQTGEHPAVRVDQMTAPGGVTIEVVKVLEDTGFAAAVMDSVDAAVNKLE